MRDETLLTTDIVLVGGGHAHVHVLKAFGMKPLPGVRLTLIARDLETPYSGMLPGHVAGVYTREQIHIDLQRLCRATGTRLIHAEAVGLDRAAKRLLLHGRAPMAYDVLSLDTGITPALDAIAGAADHALTVKPISRFLEKFDTLLARASQPGGPRRIVMVGGGAGGVELLLAVQARLQSAGRGFSFALVSAGPLLATHNDQVRAAMARVLRERGVEVHEGVAVNRIAADAVHLADGRALPCHAALLVTAAQPPDWFASTGLPLDERGFLALRPTLQSTGDDAVFAAGDCATVLAHPREKAGVFAVRQGPPLAANLRRLAQGQALHPHRPQRHFLSLLSMSDGAAIGSRGALKLQGRWVWRLKDWIDRRWMRMYQEVQPMPLSPRAPVSADDLRCGGCAAKVGPAPLAEVLARLGIAAAPEDATPVPAPPLGLTAVESVDMIRDFTGDGWRFGRIAANHALNDLYATGAQPSHALAIAAVPPGSADKVSETLYQMMAGAQSAFADAGVALRGGHSGEGSCALGFAVTGYAAPAALRRKAGLRPGDALLLTRAIGTGILFAADMRVQTHAAEVAAALEQMERSQQSAAQILHAHGATAVTDVSGFGLFGHMGEMLRASACGAQVDVDAVPLLSGARKLAERGIASTLLPENLAQSRLVEGRLQPWQLALLFDPQTAGPLLAGIPAPQAAACLAALHAAGETSAAIIGQVVSGDVRIVTGKT